MHEGLSLGTTWIPAACCEDKKKGKTNGKIWEEYLFRGSEQYSIFIFSGPGINKWGMYGEIIWRNAVLAPGLLYNSGGPSLMLSGACPVSTASAIPRASPPSRRLPRDCSLLQHRSWARFLAMILSKSQGWSGSPIGNRKYPTTHVTGSGIVDS